MTIPQVKIAPGYYVSQLIKGGWQTIGRSSEAVDDLLAFVRAGVTTFETADTYAGGEELMGALRTAARQQLPEEIGRSIKVHTRFTATTTGPGPTAPTITESIDRSLRRIGGERLDLVQLQWWNLEVPGLIEAGLVLADLQRQGKIALIGACNLGVNHLQALLEAGVPVATNQVLHSLVDRRAENRVASFCATHDIGLMTFAPLAGGFLSKSWHGATDPADTDRPYSLEYRALIEAGGGWKAHQSLLDALTSVAARHTVSVAQVALRWVLQAGPGQAVLFGASSPDRLAETLEVFDLALDAGDLATIEARGLRRSPLDVGEIERAPGSLMMQAIKDHVG